MPRWDDGGNLNGVEHVGREFGSDLVGSWGSWVIAEELPRRTLDTEAWGLGPKMKVRASFPGQPQREKGLSNQHTVCCSSFLGKMPVSSELPYLSWL